MNSLGLTAIGQLARNAELSIKGEITIARFCLIGDDEVSDGEEDGPREIVTSLWFFAFGDIASRYLTRFHPAHRSRLCYADWPENRPDAESSQTQTPAAQRRLEKTQKASGDARPIRRPRR
jgi:hypothetical protein